MKAFMNLLFFLICFTIQNAFAQFFKFNSSKATQSIISYIEDLCLEINENYEKIIIEGHTDFRGSELYNFYLGKKRAQEIKKHIVELCKVDEAKVKVVSFGKSEATQDHKSSRKFVVHIIQPNNKTIVITEKAKPEKSKTEQNLNHLNNPNYFFSFNISNPYSQIYTRQSFNWAEATIERAIAVGIQGYKKMNDGYYLGFGIDTAATISIGFGISF